jgi:hypothetical protein
VAAENNNGEAGFAPTSMSLPVAARYVPAPDHAARIAQRLHGYYRNKNLSDCQAALACMFGHADWRELCVAAAREPASAHDEAAAPEIVHAREQQQHEAVLVHLGDMTDEAMLDAQRLDQAVLSAASHSIGLRYDAERNRRRIQRARYAREIAYAKHVVRELRPSARAVPAVPADDDEIELVLRVDLLPRALTAWLTHHRPLLERWSAIVGGMRVRQRCATELIDFAFAWGELCLEHNIDVPKALQVYPIALSARWYAWVTCLGSPSLQRELAVLDRQSSPEGAKQRARDLVSQAIREEEARFLLAQPREDFRMLSASAREQQMYAGHAAIRRYMSAAATSHTMKDILSSPAWANLTPAMRGAAT